MAGEQEAGSAPVSEEPNLLATTLIARAARTAAHVDAQKRAVCGARRRACAEGPRFARGDERSHCNVLTTTVK